MIFPEIIPGYLECKVRTLVSIKWRNMLGKFVYHQCYTSFVTFRFSCTHWTTKKSPCSGADLVSPELAVFHYLTLDQ